MKCSFYACFDTLYRLHLNKWHIYSIRREKHASSLQQEGTAGPFDKGPTMLPCFISYSQKSFVLGPVNWCDSPVGKLRGAGRVLRGNSNSLSGFNLKLVSMNRLCADSEHAIYLKIYSGFLFFFVSNCYSKCFLLFIFFCLGRVTFCPAHTQTVTSAMTCLLSCGFLVTTTPRNSLKPSISDCVISTSVLRCRSGRDFCWIVLAVS